MVSEVYKLRLAKWQRIVYEANTSGMKKNEWCRLNGISNKRFYYWQKKVRAMALDEIGGGDDAGRGNLPSVQHPAFVELKMPPQSCCAQPSGIHNPGESSAAPLVLQIYNCQLQIRENASESMLRMVLRVLKDA